MRQNKRRCTYRFGEIGLPQFPEIAASHVVEFHDPKLARSFLVSCRCQSMNCRIVCPWRIKNIRRIRTRSLLEDSLSSKDTGRPTLSEGKTFEKVERSVYSSIQKYLHALSYFWSDIILLDSLIELLSLIGENKFLIQNVLAIVTRLSRKRFHAKK